MRQRQEAEATTQRATAQDEQMLPPLEKHLEATRVQSTDRGRRVAERLRLCLREHSGDTKEREREGEDTPPTANMMVHDPHSKKLLDALVDESIVLLAECSEQ